MEREQQKKQLAAELQAQIHLKEETKKREKQNKKSSDYEYLYESIHSNPFGRMGAGAPIRDPTGHVIAHRLKMYDDALATSFHKSFYHEVSQKEENDEAVLKKQRIQNLDENEIGLQFLEWSNQERKRKEAQQNEWKKQLDMQSQTLKRNKMEEKQKRLQEDLRLEEKIKKDLQTLNEEYEMETGRKSNKYDGVAVGDENSVNYVQQKKSRSRKNSEYKKSNDGRDRSGSNDRMRDFNGLNIEDDDDRSHYNPYQNDGNPREDYRKREDSLNKQLGYMKERRFVQESEVKTNLDSLMQLQNELDYKYRERRRNNNDFYNSLISENRTILSNLRAQKRNTFTLPSRAQLNLSSTNITPYEYQYQIPPSHPGGIQHESVFIPLEVNHVQNTSEVLDDLLNAYQPPQSSYEEQDPTNNEAYMNGEDSLEQFVGEGENMNDQNYQNDQEMQNDDNQE
jgi:hypothetical protein